MLKFYPVKYREPSVPVSELNRDQKASTEAGGAAPFFLLTLCEIRTGGDFSLGTFHMCRKVAL